MLGAGAVGDIVACTAPRAAPPMPNGGEMYVEWWETAVEGLGLARAGGGPEGDAAHTTMFEGYPHATRYSPSSCSRVHPRTRALPLTPRHAYVEIEIAGTAGPEREWVVFEGGGVILHMGP